MNEYQSPKYDIAAGDWPGACLVNRQTGKPIPDDEPIFILRAKDRQAVYALRAYLILCENDAQCEAIHRRIQQFENWAKEHPDRIKEPDTKMDDKWTTSGKP